MINTAQTDPSNFYSGIRVASLSKFEPKNLKYTAAHTLDLYSEVAAICRPPLVIAPNEAGGLKKHQTPSTGYIVSVFKMKISYLILTIMARNGVFVKDYKSRKNPGIYHGAIQEIKEV
uniref:Uncharacterized protein n=1 Tax=Megaselia scalaris TaxID=36166 RepID=T1GM70_MEGSC